jgi:hypothetical protein
LVVRTGRAQSATTTATAAVVTPLVVAGTAPLAFGTVFQGVNKTIAFSDATSGRLNLSGFGTSQVALTLTLPPALTSGANSMPINRYRVRVNGTNATAGATLIATTSGTYNRNLVAGQLFLFIGGRVQPAATQAFGSYSGSIVLAAAYTGL